MTLVAWCALTVAGGAGALCRYGVDRAVAERLHERFPYGILVVNLSGAFALGLLTGLTVHAQGLRVAEVGFLGAFTTFSTWMLDSERLARDGRTPAAGANLAVSLLAGLGAAVLGRAAAGVF